MEFSLELQVSIKIYYTYRSKIVIYDGVVSQQLLLKSERFKENFVLSCVDLKRNDPSVIKDLT
jgi:hypothetical protein